MSKNKKNKKVAIPSIGRPVGPTEKEKKKVILADRVGITADIPLQNLQGKSLFVATPMYGGMCHGIFARSSNSLTEICKEFGIQMTIHYLFNESLIQRGRNYCADEFMRARIGPPPPEGQEDTRPYYTHMLFIDSDIGFDPRDILFMLAISDPGNDKDVICGPYPKKCIAWEKIKVAVDRGFSDDDPSVLERFVGDYVFNPKNQGEIPLNAPAEILEGGTGFMLIQRQAFEKYKAKFPNQSYKPDHVRTKNFDGTREIMAYFDCIIDRGYSFDDVHALLKELSSEDDLNKSRDKARELLAREEGASKRYLSEDYMFCQYLQQAGGKVWLIPWVKLQHAGSYIFGGSLIDLAQLGVTPTANPDHLKNKR